MTLDDTVCTMQASDLFAPLILSLPGVGPAAFWKLQRATITADTFWDTPVATLQSLLPTSAAESVVDLLRQGQNSPAWAQVWKAHEKLLEQGVSWVSHADRRYPELLRQISQPPPLLYVRGSAAVLDTPQVAFVGSRHATQNGLYTSREFGRYLASVGLTVTSGLAVGIDTAAHKGAIEGGGPTIAVLGSGIDHIYPRSNVPLADEIVASGGAVISELPPGTGPQSSNFPRRNRIISGLSLGVLVVEAALKSGSLITARYALEQNREVFAVPGSIHNPLSRGCHALLREGATLVETADDIAHGLQGWLSQLPPLPEESRQLTLPLEDDERHLWQALDDVGITLDELSEHLDIPIGDLLATLMSLELKGAVVEQGGLVHRAPGVQVR